MRSSSTLTISWCGLVLWLALRPAAGGPPDLPPRPPPEPLLRGEHVHVAVDSDAAVLHLREPDGAPIASLPLSVALRPGFLPQVFASGGPADVRFVAADEEDGAVAGAETALFELRADGREATLRGGVRAGPFGPLLVWSIPPAVLDGLAQPADVAAGRARSHAFGRHADGRVIRVGGEDHGAAVAVAPATRIDLDVREAFAGGAASEWRFRGRLAADDHAAPGAPVFLAILVDGRELATAGPVAAGEAPLAFDVPLPRSDQLSLAVRSEGGGPARGTDAVFLDAALEGAGRRRLPLSLLLHSREPGIDLFIGDDPADPLPEGLMPASLFGVDADGRPPLIDVAAGDPRTVPPPLLPLRTAGGRWLGIGLVHPADVTRLGITAGRVSLALPTLALRAQLAPDEHVGLQVCVVVAPSFDELQRRYRETLRRAGAAPPRSVSGTMQRPDWQRLPLVFVAPHRDAPGPFDALAVRRAIDGVERRLGLREFTIVLDGGWNRLDGDARPAEDLEDLRLVIASAHVAGRRVLLRFDPFRAAPGSFADLTDVSSSGAVDPSDGRRFRLYAQEVTRRCLAEQLDAHGADGLLLAPLTGLRDPTRDAVRRRAGEGLGLRELYSALSGYAAAAERARAGALVLVPAAVPQFALLAGGVFLDVRELRAAERDGLLRAAVAAIPDVPLFFAPPAPPGATAGSPEVAGDEPLRFACRALAAGVPAVDAAQVAGLDDATAAALGAILSLARHRPLATPRVLDDGRVVMEFEGKRLVETLPGDAGVAVLAGDGQWRVALAVAGDVELPLRGRLEGESGGETLRPTGAASAVLEGGVPGRVYRVTP